MCSPWLPAIQGSGITTRSSSREARIRVPTLFCSLFSRGTLPQKKGPHLSTAMACPQSLKRGNCSADRTVVLTFSLGAVLGMDTTRFRRVSQKKTGTHIYQFLRGKITNNIGSVALDGFFCRHFSPSPGVLVATGLPTSNHQASRPFGQVEQPFGFSTTSDSPPPPKSCQTAHPKRPERKHQDIPGWVCPKPKPQPNSVSVLGTAKQSHLQSISNWLKLKIMFRISGTLKLKQCGFARPGAKRTGHMPGLGEKNICGMEPVNNRSAGS